MIEIQQWNDLVASTRVLKKNLTALQNQLELIAPHSNINAAPDNTECERIQALNRRLHTLKSLLLARTAEIRQSLTQRLSNPDDPLGDIEIDINVVYVLRTDDPNWREDSDNFLTERQYTESCIRNQEDWRTGGAFDPIPVSEQHDWLLHDLNDHDYGLGAGPLSWKNIARIGEIWVDLCIREQYFIQTDSGEFTKQQDSSGDQLR
jgi:hypothetical protein